MDLKIIYQPPKGSADVYGLEHVPAHYRAPLLRYIEQWKHLLTPYRPYTPASVAALIRQADVSTSAQVDASLLEEFGEEARASMRPSRAVHRIDL